MGLIDTITSGFRLVQRRPWLMILPIVIDLWFWLGPHLSVTGLINSTISLLSPAALPPEMAGMMVPYHEMLAEVGQRFDLWWLLDNELTWFNLLLPGLVDPARLGSRAGSDLSSANVLLLAPLLLILGVGLGSAFLTTIVSQLEAISRESRESDEADTGDEVPATTLAFWLKRGLRTWGLLVVYGLILLLLAVAFLVFLSLGLTVVLLIMPGISAAVSALLVLLVGSAFFWVYLMLYFVAAALVTDGVGLPQALWQSIIVVSKDLWSTLGLVVLVSVILLGFGFIWQRLAVFSPIGVLIGIAGNALLLTGLTAARLIFYQDRYAQWQETLAAQEATVVPPAKT
ncbi:MAG: hypothetical protein U9R25_16780 [Chloroflexota bacterium]|nr:hypothetical protein [Chloroflexota bacterium]